MEASEIHNLVQRTIDCIVETDRKRIEAWKECQTSGHGPLSPLIPIQLRRNAMRLPPWLRFSRLLIRYSAS